ncbi:MAG: hypothetical protein P1P65_08180 [Treponema sp.]
MCLISVAGNIAAAFLAAALHLPLFSDTIFTVAVTFYAGLVPGLIVAALYNPVMTLVECAVYGTEMFYFDFLYALCGMLIVLSTYLLSRNKKEFFFNRTVTILYLLLIAFVSSFLSSFAATILDTFIRPLFETISGFSRIDNFSTVFQKLQFGVFLSYLLPRIPITVLDRLMCTFLGFALYRLLDRNMSCRWKV